jgi:hypothetical protein
MRKALVLSLILVLFVLGCGGKEVTRLEEGMVTDLSGRWNDTDSRLVAQAMIEDCLSRPWLQNFRATNNREPVVIVGNIYNKTHEHISEDTFINDIERAFINSGLVQVVEGGQMRDDVREERADQQEFASEETQARWREETGADFMLNGTINSIVDSEGNRKVVYYQVDLQLVNMETNMKAWMGTKKIKKLIEKDNFKM